MPQATLTLTFDTNQPSKDEVIEQLSVMMEYVIEDNIKKGINMHSGSICSFEFTTDNEELEINEKFVKLSLQDLYTKIKFYWEAENRSKKLAENEKNEIIEASYLHQEVKSRGFKEAYEEIAFRLTGKIVNIDEDGNILK